MNVLCVCCVRTLLAAVFRYAVYAAFFISHSHSVFYILSSADLASVWRATTQIGQRIQCSLLCDHLTIFFFLQKKTYFLFIENTNLFERRKRRRKHAFIFTFGCWCLPVYAYGAYVMCVFMTLPIADTLTHSLSHTLYRMYELHFHEIPTTQEHRARSKLRLYVFAFRWLVLTITSTTTLENRNTIKKTA